MRKLLSILVASVIVSAATLAAADDPVERAAERAADAKKDNKPRHDRPQEEPTQANRPDAGDMAGTQPVVEPKAEHGDKVIPARTGTAHGHKHHHHHHAVDSDKRLYDPTDFGGR